MESATRGKQKRWIAVARSPIDVHRSKGITNFSQNWNADISKLREDHVGAQSSDGRETAGESDKADTVSVVLPR